MAKYKLGDIVPIRQGVGPDEYPCWLLNLDMVESNTGRIIDYLYVQSDEIGASTVAFDTRNVLYSKLRPYLNKVVLPDRPGFATSEMLPLMPDTTRITREYLTHFLRSPRFVGYINEKTSGAKMPRANTTDLKAAEINCPTLERQKAIVDVFECLTRIIELYQRQLRALDTLIKARFVEMFGDPETNPSKWDCIMLGEICDLQNGYAFKSDDYIDHSSVFNCRMSNIRPGGVFDADYHPKFLPEDYWETYQSYRLDDGDIIIAMTDMASDPKILGVPTIVKSNGHKFLLNQRVGKLIFREADRMNNTYVMFFLGQDYNRKSLAKSAGGSTQINVGKPAILNIAILEPPRQLQDQFASFVSQVDKSKAVVQKALDEAQLLFDSLMQEYFG